MSEQAPTDRVRVSERSPTPPRRDVPCPTCRQPHPWSGNPHRPFCSLTCRLIDLGVWLDEGYRVPGRTHSDDG
jgi:endogenous inhibitor of DNA gyrase (YacG/DUF329 family)